MSAITADLVFPLAQPHAVEARAADEVVVEVALPTPGHPPAAAILSFGLASVGTAGLAWATCWLAMIAAGPWTAYALLAGVVLYGAYFTALPLLLLAASARNEWGV